MHTYTEHKEDVPENFLRGGVPNRTMCSALAQMHLTSGLGTLNKHKNKTGNTRAGLDDRGREQILGLCFTYCHGYQNRVDTDRKRKK